ncbi:AAA domain-containing protein [Algivirga pacifica]|uniref:AAA domain-containing protein n=1 Tax=Algivirga pacifica TaxID=1162670 RepID=A0ABP9D747_9BACT
MLSKLLFKQQPVSVCAISDSRHAPTNEMSQYLRNIQRTNKRIVEESGHQDLFLGYLFVEGKLHNGQIIRSPLLLIPVRLFTQENNWYLQKREDIDMSFNKTLLHAYAYHNNIRLEDDFIDTHFGQFPSEVLPFLTELYEYLENSSLSIHFNQNTLSESLLPFTSLQKEDINTEYKIGQLKIQPQAVLGIFPQADSHLIPDYEFLIQQKQLNAVEDLVSTEIDVAPQGEEKLYNPYPIDTSQEECMIRIKEGSSMVIQGPPGSGKSQLICNLVADYISRGKNVLVVSQKRVALEVVLKRLRSKNLDKFTAIVHDHKNDRPGLYHKIEQQIEAIDTYQQRNNSLDSIFMEREFIRLSREIQKNVETLDAFYEGLYSTTECGRSVKELYLNSSLNAPHIDLKNHYRQIHFNDFESTCRVIKKWIRYYQRFDKPSYIWSKRKSFAFLQVKDYKKITSLLEQIPAYRDLFIQEFEDLLKIKLTIKECEWLFDKTPLIEKFLELVKDQETFRLFKACLPYYTSEKELEDYGFKLMMAFDHHGIESTLDRMDLDYWMEQVSKVLGTHHNWLNKQKWKILGSKKQELQSLFEKNELDINNEKDCKTLIRRIENRENYEHYASERSLIPWLAPLPEEINYVPVEKWLVKHENALAARNLYEELRIGLKFIDIRSVSFERLSHIFERIIERAKELHVKKTEWKQYFSDNMLSKLLDSSINTQKLENTLESDFEQLCEYDQLKSDYPTYVSDIIELLFNYKQDIQEDEAVELFTNSLHLHWINDIEAKYPALRIVSGNTLEETEAQLQQDLKSKRALCEDIVLMNARERTYKYIEYNRLQNMVTYRDLNHQVSKKRMVWPLRKLVSQHLEELMDLLPCWIASPEAVSNIFPMQKVFDLVIFDEASQCYAERGLPAMYRGKQTIILGDSKQLSPFDLYQTRWDTSEEDSESILEVDSLLELGRLFLPEKMLKGHYRSEALELLDFSNQHFYQGQLSLIPHIQTIQQRQPAISFEYIPNAIWEKQTNLKEAEKVVAIAESIYWKDEVSIGIITFNYHQQELIENLLEEKGIYTSEKIFVKNIENVQGDEMDLILFSIGYAPNEEGEIKAHFGSLNAVGGENRLNVAISRARKKVIVVSSLMPEDLDVEQVKNDGPKLLKAYLQYALDVSKGKYQSVLTPSSEVPFLKQLKDQFQTIEDASANLTSSLPFADLSIETNRIEGIVNTDDLYFYKQPYAKGRHAYNIMELEDKGWKQKRFYSRNYWKNPEKLIANVRDYVNQVCLVNANGEK